MSIWDVPWIEVAIGVPLIGAVCVDCVRGQNRTFGWGLVFTGSTLACTILAWIGYMIAPVESAMAWSIQPALWGRQLLAVDELSAPLLAVVALLHLLTALATARTKMRRFSLSWSLFSESLRLAMFACKEPWPLIALLIAGTVPAYIELVNRRKPTRVYVVHMALFSVLLVIGWAFVDTDRSHETQTALATIPLLAAILVRSGTVPVHCWVTDWFEHVSFGNALLFVTPLAGVYAAVRLVLPIAPDWVLQGIGIASLATAVYAACMACVQREARRFFAFLFLSHASLVLVGLELGTSISLTGALCLWISVALSLGGLGLTLRALEARYGRLSMAEYRGLYEHSPTLAVCFLLLGLASIGFPATMGFVATEMLVDGAINSNLGAGLTIIAAAALNGVAVVRAYLLLFTGARHFATVSLIITPRERIAVLTLSALILAGGLFPQFLVSSRHHAAEEILKQRDSGQRQPGTDIEQSGRSAGAPGGDSSGQRVPSARVVSLPAFLRSRPAPSPTQHRQTLLAARHAIELDPSCRD
jgi:NADH-quinone oxidoreductase subunit M